MGEAAESAEGVWVPLRGVLEEPYLLLRGGNGETRGPREWKGLRWMMGTKKESQF